VHVAVQHAKPYILPMTLPADMTALDRIALAVFVVAWLGYGTLLRFSPIRSNITERMRDVRRAWMHAMLGRDNRVTDASLLGNTMHSATFFASTAMLGLAALMGMLGKFDATFGVLNVLHFTAKTSAALVEAKVLLLIVVFAYSFLKMTWAIRQLNYVLALVGGAPLKPSPAEREIIAERDAAVLTHAISTFNAGIRGYYFALAALAWFLGPVPFLLATVGMVAVLLRRQFASATAAAMAAVHPHYDPRPLRDPA
jgi:uncharacterized membrane protein